MMSFYEKSKDAVRRYVPESEFTRFIMGNRNAGRSRFLFGATIFLTGVAVGIGAGLLLAPQSGKKTRKELGERLDEVTQQTKKTAADVVKMESVG
jgi:hypothetical protein